MTVVFGGTFDPVHLGHLSAARYVAQTLGGVQVTLLLAPAPRMKDLPREDFETRWHLLNLACDEDDLLLPSRFEANNEGPTRTVRTLRELSATSDETIVWVMGSDSLENFPNWYRAEEFPSLASLFVLRRPGYEYKGLPEGFQFVRHPEVLATKKGCIYISEREISGVSATDVRRRLSDRIDVEDLLPAPVHEHIIKNDLYRRSEDSD